MMSKDELADWLAERLTSDAGRRDARALLEAGVEAVLDCPMGEVVSEEVMRRSLGALLASGRLEDLARFSIRLGAAPVVDELSEDREPVGRHLDPEARGRLEALAMRPGLIDEGWIDVVFSQAATEELFADTLFRALDDFSETIPQVVQGVTPAAFGKLASKLGGATGGVRNRMKEELQKRLEPEIRRFVERATRRLLDGTAGFVKAGVDGEGTREACRSLLRHGLERSTHSYMVHADAKARVEIEAVLVSLARAPAAREELERRVLSIHGRLLERFGARSLRATLAAHDVVFEPDYDAWTDAIWPGLSIAVSSSAARPVLARVAEDLLQALNTPDA